MAISNTEELLFSGSVPVSVSATSVDFNLHSCATRTVVYLTSDRAGSIFVDRKNMAGTYEQIHTEAVTASTPLVVVFDWGIQRLRVRFTNGAVGTAVVRIEGAYSGHGGARG